MIDRREYCWCRECGEQRRATAERVAAATVAAAVPMHEPPTEPLNELVPGGGVPRMARLRGAQ